MAEAVRPTVKKKKSKAVRPKNLEHLVDVVENLEVCEDQLDDLASEALEDAAEKEIQDEESSIQTDLDGVGDNVQFVADAAETKPEFSEEGITCENISEGHEECEEEDEQSSTVTPEYQDVEEEEDIVDPISTETNLYPALQIDTEERSVSPVNHRKILSKLPESTEFGQVQTGREYLTEEQLRTFYMNPELERADEFLEAFVKNELSPRCDDVFYALVVQYLDAARLVEQKSTELKELAAQASQLKEATWKVEMREITQHGKCGDNRSASGKGSYPVAELRSDVFNQLKAILDKERKLLLDHWIGASHESRSAALQCQWYVTSSVLTFMEESRLTDRSPVCVVFGAGPATETRVRHQLRNAMSVLFHFIRFPSLPIQFLDDSKKWLKALAGVLLRGSTEIDHQYLLCQLLRSPVSLEGWGVGFLQPLNEVGTGHPKIVLDHFLALMAMLLSPVKMREDFLSKRIQTEIHDDSWTIVDGDGEEEESRLVSIPEGDLLALLNQFSFDKFFLKILQWNHSDDISFSQIMTLFAFELTLLKVLTDGLQVYNPPNYRQLCKRIGYLMRQSVQYVAEYWSGSRELGGEAEWVMSCQREFDRLFIFAVHCLITARKLGVWQFLVDLPFKDASSECQWRILFLLLSPDIPRLGELCQTPLAHISQKYEDPEILVHRVGELDRSDATYLLTAVSCLASVTKSEEICIVITDQMFSVCFLNGTTRDTYWNIGRDTFASVAECRPQIISKLLRSIDRNMDTLDAYSTEVLGRVNLAKWMPEMDDLILCGKWLISREPTHSASLLAQKILLELFWGFKPDGDLWLSSGCHATAAECLLKAHVSHCKSQNGLIAASIKKASKLARRVPDSEQQFDTFCWTVLLRLKLVPGCTSVGEDLLEKPDLVAFYVRVMLKSLANSPGSVPGDVSQLESILNAGCISGAVCVVCAWVFKWATKVEALLSCSSFLCCVEKVVHADAVSWMASVVGSTGFPGKNLDLLNSAIAYQINAFHSQGDMERLDMLCVAWIRILCASGAAWNSDRSILYLLDTIIQNVFVIKSDFRSVQKTLSVAHQALIKAHQAGKGLLSWFSTEAPPPLLLESCWFTEFPWLAFAAVEAEQETLGEALEKLDAVLLKYSTLSLEHALKKLAHKHKVVLSLEGLPPYRWIELCSAVSCDHPLLPLLFQKLSMNMLRRIPVVGKSDSSVVTGLRYLRFVSLKPRLEALKGNLDAAVKFHKEKDQVLNASLAQLFQAVSVWIWDPRCYNPYDASAAQTVPLDFLFQLIVSGDTSLWLNYVDMRKLKESWDGKAKLFATGCHLVPQSVSPSRFTEHLRNGSTAISRLLNRLRNGNTVVVPAPLVSLHDSLVPRLELATLCEARKTLGLVGPALEAVVAAARQYVELKKSLDSTDKQFVSLLTQLFSETQSQINVILKCGTTVLHSCQSPNNVKVLVTSSQFMDSVNMQINENRIRKSRETEKIDGVLLNNLPNHASLILEAVRSLTEAVTCTNTNSERRVFLTDSGICLIRNLIDRFQPFLLQCPLSTSIFGKALEQLGRVFVADRPEQQEFLVSMVSSRPDLLNFLIPNFTPQCLSGEALLGIFSTISGSIREGTVDREVGLSLVSKFSIPSLVSTLNAGCSTRFMEVVLETASWTNKNGMTELFETYRSHWIQLFVAFFPAAFMSSLQSLLKGCEEGNLPQSLLNDSVSKFCSQGPPADLTLTPNMAQSAIAAMIESFKTARQTLGTRLFHRWKIYVGSWMLAAENLILILVPHPDQDQPIHETEDGLRWCFNQMVSVFGPWIEPPGGVCPPWNAEESTEAAVCLRHFTATACALHSSFQKRLPIGFQTLMVLFWSYYCDKFARLKKGGTHAHDLYHKSFLRLPWSSFWPDLSSMHSMVQIFREEDSWCHSFLTNVLVRSPWSALAEQYKLQPLDASKAFYALLMELVIRCSVEESNYSECKASLPQLLDTVSSFSWSCVDEEAVHKVLLWAEDRVQPRCISSAETDIQTILLRFVKVVSSFRANPVNVDEGSATLKQSYFVRFVLSLLRRGVKNDVFSKEYCSKYFMDLASHVEIITRLKEKPDKGMSVIAKEFIEFWNKTDSNRIIDATLKGLCDWLLTHPDANLVLLFINCAVGTANALVLTRSLALTETCINAYFLSTRATCEWSEEHAEGPWLLTLYANLQNILPRSLTEEERILDELLKLVIGTKRKYLDDEAPLLLILSTVLSLLIRQFQYGSDAMPYVDKFVNWCLSKTENRQSLLGMIGISKKPLFSSKFKLICYILSYFLTQQTLTDGIRLDPRTPIINSRINAVQELKNQKQFIPFANTVELSVAFLKDTGNCFQESSSLFRRLVRSLYIERYFDLSS